MLWGLGNKGADEMAATMTVPFGERLRQLREKAEMSQEALARAAGISTSALSKLEQRDIDPSWSTVRKLARALKVSTEAFEEEGEEGQEQAGEGPPPEDKPKGGRKKKS